MARKRDPTIRAQLLEQSLESCIKRGFSGFSLRALAAEIGTSHRMLSYHFGSAEQLFQAILEQFRLRQVANFEALLGPNASRRQYCQALKDLWSVIAAPQNRDYMLSSLEIQVWSLRNGGTRDTSPYLRSTLDGWLEPIAESLTRQGFPPGESHALARLILSAGRGLLLDTLGAPNAADAADVKAAFDRLIDSLLQE